MRNSDIPHSNIDSDSKLASDTRYNAADLAYLDTVKATNRKTGEVLDDRPETPDSLFRHLILEQDGPGRVNIFTMLTEDAYWNTLLQKRRWATLACDTRVRIQLLERLRKAYTNASRKTIPAGMIKVIDKTIHKLAS